MKHFLILNACCLLLLACNNNREQVKNLMQDAQSRLVQDKQIGDTKVRLTYLPLGWEKQAGLHEEEDATEMAFRVNVNGSKQVTVNEKLASYGVDTLFQLILNRDTLAPVSAERIANGNLSGITYLVIFERRPMLPVQQAMFVFKDWLFTNTRLVFPLERKYILIADSLSHRL